MSAWQVGKVRISKVLEQELVFPAQLFLRDVISTDLLPIDWLAPHFIDERGHLRFSVHALVIETPELRILVDTCVGNHKQGRDVRVWNGLHTPFLERLASAGYQPADIDVVLCTHLHVDHVGWNTQLVDGRWQPTFTNARHLIGREELAYWRSRADDREARAILSDSLQPILDAGLVELVSAPYRVCQEVQLVPTPGHTPGHVSVRIESEAAQALITGDFIHHPCQLAHPEWTALPDVDRSVAEQTRRAELAQCADGETLVIGTHFAGPTAGYIRTDGDGYRLELRQSPMDSGPLAPARRPGR